MAGIYGRDRQAFSEGLYAIKHTGGIGTVHTDLFWCDVDFVGFGWVMLMVTDVMKGNSVLLSSDKAKYERKLSYVALGEHIYDMPGVLSRKKQLLPEILHAVG